VKGHRPNPVELLQAVQKIESDEGRGRLRVFLGMCPGVGKTYAMLRAAKEQQLRGISVLVGVAESHGRKETEELLSGMTILPKREIEYKGSNLKEMDLDLILNEHPHLVVVDELAHTNVPGCRHSKRYQDVEEILEAGIDVYTTLNIQHIESRNDQVAQITGVSVHETVPDSFLEKAEQIEMIDLSPGELLQRLKEGKVYLGEGAERAAQNFFKEEHLAALRELALRFTAEKVDQDLRDQMTIKGIEGPWHVNERLLVAVSHSPYAGRLIRATRRMAYNLEAPWVALYVDTGELLNAQDQAMLQKNLNLARRLGAEIITVADTTLSHAIQRICEDKNVTQIVMGRPDQRFFRDLFARGTLLDQLVRTTSKIDVHVIRAERKPKHTGFHFKWPNFSSGFIAYYNTAWFLVGVSFLCYALLPYVGYRAMGSVFLLAILVVAVLSSRGPIFFAAVVSALVWDYFFIPPQFTFVIRSYEDFMMLTSFFLAALAGGLLATRIRRQESILQGREERTRNLYELGRNLSEAKDISQILTILTSTITKQFGGESSALLTDGEGGLSKKEGVYPSIEDKDFAVANWVFENGKPAGWSTDTLAGSKCLCLPMKGNLGAVGVLIFYPDRKQKELTVDQENFLETVIGQVSIAVERLKFIEAAQNAKVYEASEKLHQTLINSVSHELRTPITTIIGTSTALKDKVTCLDDRARESLTDELIRSGHRLDRVVENLLDVSRLEKGTLQLKKEWFDVHDLIKTAQTDLKDELQERKFEIQDGGTSVLLEGDFRLLEHALSNLILNAIRYSDSKAAIEVEVVKDSENINILVKDHGAGIPKGKEEQLFEKFFRLPGTPAGGLGLGLMIVRSIIELHSGKVIARNRDDAQGAVFEIKFPVGSPPVELREMIK